MASSVNGINAFNQLGQCASSPSNRAYCYAAISSLGVIHKGHPHWREVSRNADKGGGEISVQADVRILHNM